MDQSSTSFNIFNKVRQLVLSNRIIVSIIFVLPALFLVQISCISLALGVPLIILGEAVRLWASGHIHKGEEVTRTGPYALCRHPLYLGHLLITAGFCIAGNHWLLIIGAPFAFWLVFAPTIAREEQHLVSTFGEGYQKYQKEIPALLPRNILPQTNPNAFTGGHKWSQVKQHREWNNVAGLIAGIVLFVAISWLRNNI
ncbi:MAG: isoprenylcysteine carboxylmethyltransferase family protein [Mariprofundales bacterium]